MFKKESIFSLEGNLTTRGKHPPDRAVSLQQEYISSLLVRRAQFEQMSHCIREGHGNPLQYSRLENPMDSRPWWAAVHGVARSQKWLSDFTFPFHFHALEKEMATHCSVLAWSIPGTGEPGGLPSNGVTQSRTRLKWLSSSSDNSLYQNFGGMRADFCQLFLWLWANWLWALSVSRSF